MVITESPARERLTAGLRHTPGRLALWMTVLIALALLAGLAAVTDVRQRAAHVDTLAVRHGPLTIAALDLYRALSDADATAASAFLSGGLEPPALRDRYLADVAEAGRALTVLGAGLTGADDAGAAHLAVLNSRLPIYTGLIETARTLNRQGLPVGAAYLREANGLMRAELLPAAQRAYQDAAHDLRESRSGGGAVPWAAVLLCLLTIGGLVVVQRRLARLTRRVLNPGLLVATGAAVLLTLWLVVSAAASGIYLAGGRDDGSDRMELLAAVRIAALQARTDEALTLVARGSGGAFEKHWTETMEPITRDGGTLDALRRPATDADAPHLDRAVQAADAWVATHRDVRARDDGGDYPGAVTATLGDAATHSAALDDALGAAIAADGDVFAAEARRAGAALRFADLAAGALTLTMIAGIAIGVQRRRAEYR
ncbi:hypothetical protein J2S43_003099 [Catenuloplanes nepalensis]|uniref:Secreted protein n=1 Tax=Catenuloplanes nepalensis TaxID=587533 RepID=A0ABT9MT16_9ACTN|nr:hypothetical protein [Catenuloplanes nepalensis]MDP9794587.1 hypothetical protein [Catenuloplanes nepalensis]